MTDYTVTALENVGPTRMWKYAEGDPLLPVGTFTVGGSSIEAALEALWYVGNKMGPDASGATWPADRRSLCIGDVVLIDGATWVCAMVGWQRKAEYLMTEV